MSTESRASARLSALSEAGLRKARRFGRPKQADQSPMAVSEFFGCNTFSYDLMAQKLDQSEVALLRDAPPSSRGLTRELADKVADAVREWAVARGATHYCHWFQPQTGATAEKHDSFFSLDGKGEALEQFSGKQLMQSEPDASSFPSGGRRSTFEARGYTAWDSSSPMFLLESVNGLTLCIPSVFISYSGEALDQKTPLLKSIDAVSKAAVESLELFGETDAKHVIATCGPEQEYFVVDRSLFVLRPDLVLCGRTLVGSPPPKGQQLEDHYFGTIKSRVLAFMMEAEHELYKLGVPCKTRHNEVAPSQCEAAPIFEFANVAADHNQLVMEVLRTVGKRHDLRVLFHEKPYGGMNGSGKHLNWSLADSNGNNLLEPGDNPASNLRFLYFLTAAIKGVHEFAPVIRSTVASAGNDFRLGANEAPPAIMSVFLGETLTEVFARLTSGKDMSEKSREINLDLARVPVIARDNTDRNRTSPFAFTGNKFEFRALGSSQSVSDPTAYLNVAMANTLSEMNEKLKAKSAGSTPTDNQILEVIRETYESSKQVCFEGNNYDEAWHKEAGRRGLPNLKDTPSALRSLLDPVTKKKMVEHGIYNTEDELDSRYNVLIERYNKTRMIEIGTLLELVSTHVVPAGYAYLKRINETAKSTKDITGQVPTKQKALIESLSAKIEALLGDCEKLATFRNRALGIEDDGKLGDALSNEGLPLMEQIQTDAASVESLVDDDLWSLPKVRELIFTI